MITTIFLLLLITFEIWYLTSKQVKHLDSSIYVSKIGSNQKQFRIAASVLFFIALALCVLKLGWASGIIGVVVGLMAAGNMVVAIKPFRYVSIPVVIGLYVLFLVFEIFIY